jgi:hypothetical protein
VNDLHTRDRSAYSDAGKYVEIGTEADNQKRNTQMEFLLQCISCNNLASSVLM